MVIGFNWPLWPRQHEKRITSVDDTLLEDYRVVSFHQKEIVKEDRSRLNKEFCEYIAHERKRKRKTGTIASYCLDFSNLEYVSIEGLVEMVNLQCQLSSLERGCLNLVNVCEDISVQLGMYRLNKLFDIYPTLKELPSPN